MGGKPPKKHVTGRVHIVKTDDHGEHLERVCGTEIGGSMLILIPIPIHRFVACK